MNIPSEDLLGLAPLFCAALCAACIYFALESMPKVQRFVLSAAAFAALMSIEISIQNAAEFLYHMLRHN
jgi:hypothetical protein